MIFVPVVDRPVDVRDNRGWIAIHEAAYHGNIACLQLLLTHAKEFVSAATFETMTPLHLACRQGHIDCVKMLLKHGANPAAETGEFIDPLWEAVATNVECVKLLVKAGVNVNHRIFTEETPLHRAAFLGKADIVKHLLKHKSDIDVQDENGLTPLFVSAQTGHFDCLSLLVSKAKELGHAFVKKYVNTPACDGATPLYLSAQGSHVKCVELLLENNADANIPVSIQYFKVYPFQAALYFTSSSTSVKNAIKCAELLLHCTDLEVFRWKKYAPDATQLSTFFMHPVHIAMTSFNVELIKFLVKIQNSGIYDFFSDEDMPLDTTSICFIQPLVYLASEGYASWLLEYMEKSYAETESVMRNKKIEVVLLLARLSKYKHKTHPVFLGRWFEKFSDKNEAHPDKNELQLVALFKYYTPPQCIACKHTGSICLENLDLSFCDDNDEEETHYRDPLITGGQLSRQANVSRERVSRLMSLQHLVRRHVMLLLLHNGKYTRQAVDSLGLPAHLADTVTVPTYTTAFEKAQDHENAVDCFLDEVDHKRVLPRLSSLFDT